jgi:hypothetical protein
MKTMSSLILPGRSETTQTPVGDPPRMVKERERREHAERVTKGLVALQPFVLPTPKPVALEPVGMSSLQWRRPCGDAFVGRPLRNVVDWERGY